MTWLGIILLFVYLHEYARSRNLSCLDPFCSYLLIPEERKNIWSELESNPGPLALQATALTNRPWLLGQCIILYMMPRLWKKILSFPWAKINAKRCYYTTRNWFFLSVLTRAIAPCWNQTHWKDNLIAAYQNYAITKYRFFQLIGLANSELFRYWSLGPLKLAQPKMTRPASARLDLRIPIVKPHVPAGLKL